jgi:hypothetical protein
MSPCYAQSFAEHKTLTEASNVHVPLMAYPLLGFIKSSTLMNPAYPHAVSLREKLNWSTITNYKSYVINEHQ